MPFNTRQWYHCHKKLRFNLLFLSKFEQDFGRTWPNKVEVLPWKPYSRENVSTVNLLIKVTCFFNKCELYFQRKFGIIWTSSHKEVNRTERSPSVRVLWFCISASLKCKLTGVIVVAKALVIIRRLQVAVGSIWKNNWVVSSIRKDLFAE
jgi:hypothetical protein